MKKTVLFLAAMTAVAAASAKQLTADEALARFRDANNAPLAAKALKGNATNANFVVEKTMFTADHAEALYLCRNGNSMVVLPADDRVMPVLGYFDAPAGKTLPQKVQLWLDEYARQIAYLQTMPEHSCQAKARIEDYAPIEPMVTTKWGESKPYNAQLPTFEDGSLPYVGPDGLDFAEVMRYHKYPQQATGSISYEESGVTHSMDFTEQAFDWENMLDIYNGDYTNEQLNAMAYLVKACTYAAKTKFHESCASFDEVPLEALVNCFGYSDKVRMLFRDFVGYDEWEALVYKNLTTVGPLVYGGADSVYGFCFVVDGYDSDGFFHINWALEGDSDGYFQLDAIHEYGTNEHGAVGGYNYTFYQDAVFNITPAGNETISLPDLCPIIWSSNVIATLTDVNTIALGYDSSDRIYESAMYCTHYSAGEFELALKATKEGETNATILSDAATLQYTLDLYGWAPGTNDVTFNFKSGTGLAAGTYSFSPVVRIKGSDRWEDISHSLASNVQFTAQIDDNGNIVKVTSNPNQLPTAQNVTVVSPYIIMGNSIKYSFDLVNSLDADVSNAFLPQILVKDSTTDELIVIAEGEVVTDPSHANETKHLTYVSDMTVTDDDYASYVGDAYFALRNQCNDKLSELIPITIHEKAHPSFQADAINVSYDKADPATVTVDFTVTCTKGYFNDTFSIFFDDLDDNDLAYFEGDQTYELLEGESVDSSISFRYADYVPNTTYRIYLCQNYTDENNGRIGYIITHVDIALPEAENDGIAAISAESAIKIASNKGAVDITAPSAISSIEAYAANGSAVNIHAAINGTSATASLPYGLTLLKVTLANGTTAIAKLSK
jgi:hypothetical protein